MKNAIRLILLTSIFSTQLSWEALSMNPDEDPSRQSQSTRGPKGGNPDLFLQREEEARQAAAQAQREFIERQKTPIFLLHAQHADPSTGEDWRHLTLSNLLGSCPHCRQAAAVSRGDQ